MKIKEYFNEKPRLRRAIKIITKTLVIFFAALGVVFSGILIGSCANQKAKQVVATTPIQHQKPIQNALDYNGYNYIFSVNDICNDYVVTNLKYAYGNIFQSTTINDSYIYADLNEYAGSVYGSWGNVDFDTCSLSTGFSFNAIQLVLVSYSEDSNTGTYFRSYQIYVYNTHNSTRQLLSTIDYISNDGASGKVINLWPSTYTEKAVYVSNMENPYLIQLLIADTNDGYMEGYQNGYQSGSTSGYRNGYTDGYDQGLEDSEGLSTNPFNLIANAFEAVASILDIDILPHLKLGVLIFTPLIVTIIIIVVKMIRG